MEEIQSKESRSLAISIAELLDQKKAENIEIFDVAKMSSISDYFVVSTVNSTTQAKAIADFVEESLNKTGVRVLRRDGIGEWIVLDYNTVIVHIFLPNRREFYHLDKLWTEGKNVFTLEEIKKQIDKEKKAIEQKNAKLEKAQEKASKKGKKND